jgi:glycerol uptake facilitator-like aquaporin
MNGLTKALAAELIGTFALIFLGAGAATAFGQVAVSRSTESAGFRPAPGSCCRFACSQSCSGGCSW